MENRKTAMRKLESAKERTVESKSARYGYRFVVVLPFDDGVVVGVVVVFGDGRRARPENGEI